MDITNKLDIIRLNTSSYQGEEYQRIEKEELEKKFPLNYKSIVDPNKEHILITNSNTSIESLNITNKTKLIIHPNSGYDNFSFEFVKECPCPILIGNEIRMNAVVNYTISALLEHIGNIPQSKSWDKNRKWNRLLLEDRKIQLIGNGHIGEKVNQIISSLGGKLNIFDPFKGYTNLDTSGADIIILCASLNPTSHHILNSKVLSSIAKDALIINGARGALIDQKALIEHLKKNPNSFAYLDVFEEEPFDDNEFSGITNMYRSSHIAGVHKNLNSNLLNFQCKILASYFSSNTIEKFKNSNKSSLLSERLNEDFLI